MTYVQKRVIAASSVLGVIIGCSSGGSNGGDRSPGSGASGGAGGSAPSAGGAAGVSAGSGGTTMTASGGTSGAPVSGAGFAAMGGGSGSGGSAAAAGSGGGMGNVAGMSSAGMSSAGMSGSGSGAAGAGTGGTGVSGGLTLTIEPNQNSVLSCYVSWKTDAPANSVVQFGVGGYEWEISDDAPVTDHRVLVIGMHAAQTYAIKAISGSASGEGTFTTGQLPSSIPVGTVMINDKTHAQPGWTLMNVQVGGSDSRPRSSVPPQAVMYDADGQPVWYFIDGPGPDIGGAVSTQLTDKGVLIGPTWNQNNTNGVPPREVDFGGNVVWECKHAACQPGADVTHEAKKLTNGHYVVLEYVTVGGAQNPVFRELDADSKEVWTLDWTKLLPAPSGSTGDWCHGNAISIDIDKNEVYANCRWVGLMKASYTNPAYQWLIPAKYGSKGLGDFTYSPPASQYSDAHDPEFHDDDDTVMFYDNGGWSGMVGGDTSQYHSRAVEYKIDAAAKTATLDWEFPGQFQISDTWYTTKWYSPFWGDVDRLANGNVLITGGQIGPGSESRVFEVTKADGKIVWEFRFPSNFGVYRSDRIVPPLVHAITQ